MYELNENLKVGKAKFWRQMAIGVIRAKLLLQLISNKTWKNKKNKKVVCLELIFKPTTYFV